MFIKINPNAVRSYIQWLGLRDDGKMESDRLLVSDPCADFVTHKYQSPDGKFYAVYTLGYLEEICLDGIHVEIHVEADRNGKILSCVFSNYEDGNEYEYAV